MDRTSIQIFEAKKLALQKGDEAVLQQGGRGKDIVSILCMYKFPNILSDILVLTY
jgi:hypothetical protein